MKKLVVDPPGGWRYGFPMPVPEGYTSMEKEGRIAWFLEQGYPEEDIGLALQYSRFYIGEVGDN